MTELSDFIGGDLEERQNELLKLYRRRIRAICTKSEATKMLKWIDEWIAAPAPKPAVPADLAMVHMKLRIDIDAAVAWKQIETIERMKAKGNADDQQSDATG